MNILYLNHYAGSPEHGMEYRPYYLAREWVRAGHSVRMVACAFSHVRSSQPETGNKPRSQIIDGIEYCWYPGRAYRGNGVGRVRNIWDFLSGVWRDSRRIAAEFRPDAVIASSTYPLDIWVARRLARLAGAKLVYEVHDLWPLSPIELGGMSPRHPFIVLCQLAENTAYRDADLVVSMLPNVQQHMAAHGLDPGKLRIIPNGIAVDEWTEEPAPLDGELGAYVAAVRSRGDFLVGYAGSHGLPNALDRLLDAAALLRNDPVSFVLVGDGHERARLLARVADEGLSNVAMFGPVAKKRIPALLAAIDVAYIGWSRNPLYRFGISPNKLLDYMMAGRPVLHSVAAANDLVAESSCGLSVPPDDPPAIAAAIRRLALISIVERERMGARGRSYVLANHDYRVLAGRFLGNITPGGAGP